MYINKRPRSGSLILMIGVNLHTGMLWLHSKKVVHMLLTFCYGPETLAPHFLLTCPNHTAARDRHMHKLQQCLNKASLEIATEEEMVCCPRGLPDPWPIHAYTRNQPVLANNPRDNNQRPVLLSTITRVILGHPSRYIHMHDNNLLQVPHHSKVPILNPTSVNGMYNTQRWNILHW